MWRFLHLAYDVWLSREAVEDRQRLSKGQEGKLLWWRDRLADDPTVGSPIHKSLIPKPPRKKYNATNLFRLELPLGWRILYTIVSSPGIRPEVHILRIVSHEEYDRLFGY